MHLRFREWFIDPSIYSMRDLIGWVDTSLVFSRWRQKQVARGLDFRRCDWLSVLVRRSGTCPVIGTHCFYDKILNLCHNGRDLTSIHTRNSFIFIYPLEQAVIRSSLWMNTKVIQGWISSSTKFRRNVSGDRDTYPTGVFKSDYSFLQLRFTSNLLNLT